MRTVNESVISGPHWSVVSAVVRYCPSDASAADGTSRCGQLNELITVGGVKRLQSNHRGVRVSLFVQQCIAIGFLHTWEIWNCKTWVIVM